MNNMMSNICAFLVVFCVISNVHGSVQRQPCNKPTMLSSTLIEAFLDAHNDLRSQAGAADMLKLVWSDRLASLAQCGTEWCQPGWTDCVSESLFNMSLNIGNKGISPHFDITDVPSIMEQWTTHDKFELPTPYNRLMWASSSEIGCGLNECVNGLSVNGFPDWSIA